MRVDTLLALFTLSACAPKRSVDSGTMVEGEVLAQFVVDTSGRVERATVKVL